MCSICLTDITLNKKELSCKHKYHTECIDKWLERKSTCPICRKEVGQEEPVMDFTLPNMTRRRTDRYELFTRNLSYRSQYYRTRLDMARERYRRTLFRNTHY